MTQTIEEARHIARKAYQTANSDTKGLLNEIFGTDAMEPDMTIIIGSFEDACKWNGTDSGEQKFTIGEPHTIARSKAEEIVKALNNGAKIDYNNPNQQKWYAWMIWDDACSGFRFDGSGYGFTFTTTLGGPRLCLIDKKRSDYFGTHFTDLINQMLS